MNTSPEAKAALAWTHTARFVTTASQLDQLPVHELPEIAFVGRSNAGKSTAINTLAQQKRLAFASKTPGRTQHINLFALGPKDAPDAYFADLPGYGYAAVERAAKLRWQQVMADYLAVRRSLSGVVLMIDPRLGLTDLDRQLLAWVAPRVGTGEVKLLVLLTKADKLSRRQADAAVQAATEALAELSTDDADIGVLLFSALAKTRRRRRRDHPARLVAPMTIELYDQVLPHGITLVVSSPWGARRAAARAAAARLSGRRVHLGRGDAAPEWRGALRGAEPAWLRKVDRAARRRCLPRQASGRRHRSDDRHAGRADRPAGRARLGRCGRLDPGGAAAGTDDGNC